MDYTLYNSTGARPLFMVYLWQLFQIFTLQLVSWPGKKRPFLQNSQHEDPVSRKAIATSIIKDHRLRVWN